MTRAFDNGRQSEVVFNEELTHLFKTIEVINETPIAGEPDADYEGKLWIDKHSGDQIKISRNNHWSMCFNNEISILAHLGDETTPPSPVNNQLWIDEGILKYYNPTEGWKPLKADTTGAAAIRSFADFIYNNAHLPAGKELTDTTLEPSVKYYQYLTPAAEADKVFLSQGYVLDETREDHPTVADKEIISSDGKKTTSDVSLELRQGFVNTEKVNTIHINPVRLNKIIRKTILLDGVTQNFNIKHDNSEFYGIKNGTGLFLREGSDYTTSPYGITLLHPEEYDFLHVITYEFLTSINTPGSVDVIKGKTGSELKIPLDYIVPTLDFQNFAVFIEGLYLDEDHIVGSNTEKNYELDPSRKFIKVNGLDNLNSLVAVAVLRANNKYSSTIPSRVGDVGHIPISSVPITFNNPIIFVRGIEGFHPADYNIVGSNYEVEQVTSDDMEYVLIDIDEDTTGTVNTDNMIVETGVTDASGVITFDPLLIPDDEKAILWCNGILITDVDLKRDNIAHSLSFDGFVAGLDYVLLRDPSGKMLINKYISPSALFSSNISDAVVYSENFLLLNATDLLSSNLAAELAFDGEIKNLDGKFYYFNSLHKFSYFDTTDNKIKTVSLDILVDKSALINGQWYPVDIEGNFLEDVAGETIADKAARRVLFDLFKTSLEEKEIKIKEAQVGYTVNTSYIDIINGIDDQNISAYCYEFTNNISKPLLVGHIDFDMTNPNTLEYQVGLRHSYENGVNGTSLFIDGYKQYHNVEKGDTKTLVIPEPLGEDNVKVYFDNNPAEYEAWKLRTGNTSYIPHPAVNDISYILEGLETGETYACQRTILDRSNRVQGTINTYKSDIPLFPGKITVFLGGLRVPKESVKILSSNILMLEVNNNTSGTDSFNDIINTEDKILVEIRNDYNIKELTMEVDFAGQTTFDIPVELANAKDTILIYINGLFYGSDYIIDKLNKKLTITNNSLINTILGKNETDSGMSQPNISSNLEKYFIDHPGERYDYIDYKPNYITFEWR